MKLTKSIALLVAVFIFCASAQAITIPTVRVGNLGNANDAASGNLYGGVSYAYNMGTTEVTVGQYTAFLNAVAATDTYSLYFRNMANDLNIAGIAQSGASGNYTYSVIGSPNHPIAYVSWGNAARFSNWLNNGQPVGPQNTTTTEDGAYTLNGAVSNAAVYAVTRNASAKWFIPSESEWYKAAYHQPAAQGGDSDDYWNYPMRTNSLPYSDQPPGATPNNTRVGNFNKNDGLGNGYDDGFAVTGSTLRISSQNYLTDVGAYASSPSFYGTFDQGGNVWEWNEMQFGGSHRGLRGSGWSTSASLLAASSQNNYWQPVQRDSLIGFRVANVPEPATVGLVAVGLSVAGAQRRSQQRRVLARRSLVNNAGRSWT